MKLESAISLALRAHEGQKDKQGEPYILHCIAVMMMGKTTDEKIVGILHDTVEDTNISKSMLRLRLSTTQFDALVAITRKKGEVYADFIQRVSKNKLATRVKINDLTHNMCPSRRLPEYKSMLRRYQKAMNVLKETK